MAIVEGQGAGSAGLADAKLVTMDILHLAAALEACPVERVRWFFEAGLSCCEGLTSHQLVEAGRAGEVLAFLRRALFNEQREWSARPI
ncbi:hypothetical protein ABIE56_000280 [Luteibacter sp. 621]|uniref:hypothetical protein n=1 Tax=Luteibacter sp. 621 TaxID=3373916 RepID=UPI003D197312